MKIRYVLTIPFMALAILSCEKNLAPDSESQLTDEALILAIQNSADKQTISEYELPGASRSILDQEYTSEITIEATIAPELGYEVFRGGFADKTGKFSEVYFNLDGRKLSRRSDGKSPHGKHGNRTPSRGGADNWSCFEVVYPISFIMPDETIITAEEQAGLSAVREWYVSHPDSREKPSYQYPINLMIGDSAKTIWDEDEMNLVYRWCGGKKYEKKPCFTFIFPVTYLTADGTSFTVASDDESSWAELKAWYEANPENQSRPEIVFPQDIKLDDQTTRTLENIEDLMEVKEACEENSDEHLGRQGGINDRGAERLMNQVEHRDIDACFQLVFPLSYMMPDESILIISDREDRSALRAWYVDHPDYSGRPVLQFPVDIILEDGTTTTLNDVEEMRAARAACHDDRRGGHGGNGDGRHGDHELCFQLVFPITHIMPDGSLITVEDQDGMSAIRAWYTDHPDVRVRPTLQFPVDIIFEDGSTVTLEDESELSAARAACDDDGNHGGNGDGRHGDYELCFQLVFPITHIMPDGSLITVEDQNGMSAIRAWYVEHPDTHQRPSLQFPVEIIYADGSTVTLNDETELRAAREACDEDDGGDHGNGNGNGDGGGHGGGDHRGGGNRDGGGGDDDEGNG